MSAFTPAVRPRLEDKEVQESRGRTFVSLYASILAAATFAFVMLAIFVRDEDLIRYFDAPVAQAIQGMHWPVVGWVLTHTSDLGVGPYDVACVAAISIGFFLLRLRLEGVGIAISTVAAGQLGLLAKDLVQRARPTSSFVHLASRLADYSFPSGHVIFATVLFGTAFWIVWITWHNSFPRTVVLAGLATVVLLMGPSRVYLGAHWPTDVIGAYCVAGLWVAATVELMLVLKPRFGQWWKGRPHRRQWKPLV